MFNIGLLSLFQRKFLRPDSRLFASIKLDGQKFTERFDVFIFRPIIATKYVMQLFFLLAQIPYPRAVLCSCQVTIFLIRWYSDINIHIFGARFLRVKILSIVNIVATMPA